MSSYKKLLGVFSENMENLTYNDLSKMENKRIFIAKDNKECIEFYKDYVSEGIHCSPEFDRYICWPPISPGSNVTHPCPRISAVDIHVLGYTSHPEAFAVRTCNETGEWMTPTDYKRCISYFDAHYEHATFEAVLAYVIFIGCTLSLITLTLSFIAFSCLKSLYCSSTKVHQNLCVSLFMHTFLSLLKATETLFYYSNRSWLCKAILCSRIYFSMASISWMFVEGLLLHKKVVVDVFRQGAPFKLYYFIGWGLPAILITTWCGLMKIYYDKSYCWLYFGQSKLVYIVVIPIITALLINSVFLINIIRVIVVGSRQINQLSATTQATSSAQRTQIKKAVKAGLLLLPLLGITHLLFCFKIGEPKELKLFYMMTNALFQSSQGFVFGVLYCFLNRDVQKYLKNICKRSRSNHGTERQIFGTLLSQTSRMWLSVSENIMTHLTSRQKTSSTVLESETRS